LVTGFVSWQKVLWWPLPTLLQVAMAKGQEISKL
jgi:hypothetical protein